MSTEPLEAVSTAVWSLQEAVVLCSMIEAICPQFGCHVALTGGLLYKPGPRKDCDILFYRIRQESEIDRDGLLVALDNIPGFQSKADYGWMTKATYHGKSVDIFFPEHDDEDSEYPASEPTKSDSILKECPIHEQ